ncbi:tyrosine-protein phosphatase [Curtobacterium sp. RRHDQ10]|uniref:tyrosine-protein phosphatase n=1 Tax=Curtobacterium phyllosphaerae TaxID=3413379 RepID=UPI003BEFF64E
MTTSTLTNLREVGGPGLQVGRPRTVFRSNTEPGVDADAYPTSLSAVVDLRRDDELDAVPHPLRDSAGYRSVPLFDPSEVETADMSAPLEAQYLDWLVRHRGTIAEVFRTLSGTPGDVLVCCSAGKDRTGVVSALLARLWGADLDRVGADYGATADALAERFARERSVAEQSGPEAARISRIMQRCVPEVAVHVVEQVEERYGSVRGYLRWIGLSDREVDRL